MDPALLELLRARPADQEVEAILRLTDPAARIPGVRVVSRFGTIVTCRLPLDRVIETREQDEVASMKAARLLGPEASAVRSDSEMRTRPSDMRRPSGIRLTGRGCVVGFLDWGFAFGNASLRHSDGRTRLLALWDQRRGDPRRPNGYGYGTIHNAAGLNAALATGDPYRALRYHPAESDGSKIGAHGTHTVDIAVGNGRSEGPMGLAPEADIVCVHLGTEAIGANPLLNLGDSVRVLEGIDFIRRVAGGRPFVISASIGRHGGPHDGKTLFEMSADFLLAQNPNALSVHSAGNYHSKNIHASGRLMRGETHTLRLFIDRNDRTPNEVEIWYDRGARLSIRIETPDGEQSRWVPLGQRAELAVGGRIVFRIYHRERDPQNDANVIDIFIEPGPPAGVWRLVLRADEAPPPGSIFHAWVERDDACGACQARFHSDDADSSVTTSTLANATRTISVGAVNAHDPARSIAHFSSAGPTRDGRTKPDCVAPGVGVLAARSPWFGESDSNALARRSGTSMAAPHVSGCAALLLEAGRGRFGDGELREIILSTVDSPGAGSEPNRYGLGYLNVERAVAAAERVARRRETPAGRSFVHLGSLENHAMPSQQDFSARLLDLVDQLVGQSRNVTADELLRVVLQQAGGLDSSPPARKVYRAMRGGGQSLDPALRDDRLKVVAQPLERFAESIAAGDVIVRRALGEGGLTHVAIAAGPELRRHELAAAGLIPEDDGGGPGWYVQVVEGGFRPHGIADRFARRIGDHSRRGGSDQIVLRITPTDCGCQEPRRNRDTQNLELDTEQVAPPDSTVANNGFVAAHPTRWCSPGAVGSVNCGALSSPRPIRRVVIHVLSLSTGSATRSDAQAIVRGWQNAGAQASSHYIVDHDGTITQMVREADVAFHAGAVAVNQDSIGIEHGDVCNDPTRFGQPMYERSAELVRDIGARYAIVLDGTTVIGHDSFGGAAAHDDPGPYWDWEYYIALLEWDGLNRDAKPLRVTGGPVGSPAGWRSVARRAIARDLCATTHDPYSARYLRAPQSAAATDPPAELSLVINEPGVYRASLWWPLVAGANSTTPVDLELTCMASPCTDVFQYSTVVDQRTNFGRWSDLGARFEVTSPPIELRARIRRDAATNGVVIADALRCIRVAPLGQPRDAFGEAEAGKSVSQHPPAVFAAKGPKRPSD